MTSWTRLFLQATHLTRCPSWVLVSPLSKLAAVWKMNVWAKVEDGDANQIRQAKAKLGVRVLLTYLDEFGDRHQSSACVVHLRFLLG